MLENPAIAEKLRELDRQERAEHRAGHAHALLVDEFHDAIDTGPDTLVSTHRDTRGLPTFTRAPLAQVVRQLIELEPDDSPTVAALLEVLRVSAYEHGDDDAYLVIDALAKLYAGHEVDSLGAAGAFNDEP